MPEVEEAEEIALVASATFLAMFLATFSTTFVAALTVGASGQHSLASDCADAHAWKRSPLYLDHDLDLLMAE